MATSGATLPRAADGTRVVPHTVSPGLWTLAWRRLRADRVGMVSLAIVVAFLVLIVLSGIGLIAKDWSKEVGVNYAPPSFLGADVEAGAPAGPAAPATSIPATEYQSAIVGPLGDVIAELKGAKPAAPADAAPAEGKSVDPLADVMADIRAGKGAKAEPVASEVRSATLPVAAATRTQLRPLCLAS